MHGLQPSPGPLDTPSVLMLHVVGHTDASGMPMSIDTHDDGQDRPHDGHAAGQVCLAFLLAGALLLLLLLVMTAAARAIPLSIRPLLSALPRGPTACPHGPTLAQLCVIRV